MTITETTVKNINLTAEEYESLCATEQILEEIYNSFGHFVEVVNPTTGEVVMMNELPRVRGILSAFTGNSSWEVKLV